MYILYSINKMVRIYVLLQTHLQQKQQGETWPKSKYRVTRIVLKIKKKKTGGMCA